MPELPEVETVRRGLIPVLEGAQIAKLEQRRPDLRFPFPERFAARLTGRRVTALTRRAKYLLGDLDNGDVLIAHLGMSGSFRIEIPDGVKLPGVFHHDRSRIEAHDHVVITTDQGERIIYNDPRRFGFMLLADRATLPQHPLFSKMGVEPLGNALSAAYLANKLAGKSTSMKAALLDQRIVVGLGNIYVAEALWRSGISPKRRAGTLVRKSGAPAPKLEALISHIKDVLREAIAAGGSSLRDHAQTSGELGYFQHRFAVYDREGEACVKPGCGGTVKRIVQSNRSTFYCGTCQR